MKHRVKLGHKERVTLKITLLVMLLVSLESPRQGGVHVSHFAILRAKVIKFKPIFVIEN
jgi:hypothetical protein